MYMKEVGNRLNGDVYLDYTAATLYGTSQIEKFAKDMLSNVYGNPHSGSPSATASSDVIDNMRTRILQHFNASPVEYHVVFTKSATGALKLVGEDFPWTQGSTFTFLVQNHNSVLGIREYALERGGSFKALDFDAVEAWLSSAAEDAGDVFHLFAFPAEENFAGKKFPLEWVARARARKGDRTKVLLDAAAYVPTNPLDLREIQPDFVSLSFYKMFGFPTGLGCLLVRADSLDLLRETYWGGGQVSLATAKHGFHVMNCSPSERLEDGTMPFLDIAALKYGFETMDEVGGVKSIQRHTHGLAAWLAKELEVLTHSNGKSLVHLLGDWTLDNDGLPIMQGSVLNFCVLDQEGYVVPYKLVESAATARRIHIRTGAECNPGACYAALGVLDEEVVALEGLKEGCRDGTVQFIEVPRDIQHAEVAPLRGGPAHAGLTVRVPQTLKDNQAWVALPLGSVRVSLGIWSTWEDCQALLDFLTSTYRDH